MTIIMKQPHPIAGFFLLEALIALFVFSVGFLGLGTFQLLGLQASREAGFRDHATDIAQELAERIHGNAAAAVAGHYSGVYPGSSCDAAIVPSCSDDNGTAGSLCSSQEMALFDVQNLYCSAEDLLPSVGIQVSCNDLPCVATSSHTIIVSWAQSGRTLLQPQSYCPTGNHCIALNVVP